MSRAVMQQALGALRQCEYTTPPAQRKIVKDAITALREALAQPEQERAAVQGGILGYVPLSDDGKTVFIGGVGEVPLAYLPMTLPAQPAKPLTDEQIEALAKALEAQGNSLRQFARAIEAKHGIKEHL